MRLEGAGGIFDGPTVRHISISKGVSALEWSRHGMSGVGSGRVGGSMRGIGIGERGEVRGRTHRVTVMVAGLELAG